MLQFVQCCLLWMFSFLMGVNILSKNSLEAQPLDLIEINGYSVFWPGQMERGDYFAAGTHFKRRILNNDQKGRLSGEFSFDPQFLTTLGLMLDEPTPHEIQSLIQAHSSQIDENYFVRRAVELAAKDRKFFQLFEAFLKDGGTLVGEDTGFYQRPQSNAEHPKIIVFGSPELVSSGAGHLALASELLNANVVFHELLHYALDKIDHYTSETSGWDDHASFEAIETRFRIIQTLKTGLSPLLAARNVVQALDRYNIEDKGQNVDHPELTYYYQPNPSPLLLDRVGEILQRPDFDTKYVEASMLWNLMSSHRYPPCAPERQVYDDDDLKDLAYLHAFNARLLIDSIRIAHELARRRQVNASEVYGTTEFQTLFDRYRNQLAESQKASHPESLRAAGIKIVTSLLR